LTPTGNELHGKWLDISYMMINACQQFRKHIFGSSMLFMFMFFFSLQNLAQTLRTHVPHCKNRVL